MTASAGRVFTLLIVEDEEPMREFLAQLLTDDGYNVRLAIHGRHALELIEQERPDLVLSDLMMPVLDGAELSRRLKASDDTRQIPIILMTSSGRRAADRAAAEAYIAKPFDLERLEELIQRWLPSTDQTV